MSIQFQKLKSFKLTMIVQHFFLCQNQIACLQEFTGAFSEQVSEIVNYFGRQWPNNCQHIELNSNTELLG